MKARDWDPLRLDVEAFAKAGAELNGSWPLSDLERLASSAVAALESSHATWNARGELRAVRGGAGEIWLHLQASTSLMLECQRCLSPVGCAVEAQRSFQFVRGEDQAAELDAESEDDVLALTRALDLRELVEDELLLALPLVPRHEACPAPLVAPAQEASGEAGDEKVHPFAALAALKKGGLPN